MNLHGFDHYDENTWWDCVKNDMESLGRPKMMHSPGINGGELREQPLNPGSPGIWLLKRLCVSIMMLGVVLSEISFVWQCVLSIRVYGLTF